MNIDLRKITDDDRPVSSEDDVLLRAEFDDAVTSYWLIGGSLTCIFTCFGIVFLPFWLYFGKRLTRKYLAAHECVLTPQALKFRKGVLTRIEKTVPLDKITDLSFVQGPLMRMYGIESLAIETAGTSGPGALVQIQGIKNSRAFRDEVLKQRDQFVLGVDSSQPPSPVPSVPNESVFQEMQGTLLRIEKLLAEKDR